MINAVLGMSGGDPTRTLVIGDQESDVIAAAEAGCWSLRVQSGDRAGGAVGPSGYRRTYLGSVPDLLAAARLLVG